MDLDGLSFPPSPLHSGATTRSTSMSLPPSPKRVIIAGVEATWDDEPTVSSANEQLRGFFDQFHDFVDKRAGGAAQQRKNSQQSTASSQLISRGSFRKRRESITSAAPPVVSKRPPSPRRDSVDSASKTATSDLSLHAQTAHHASGTSYGAAAASLVRTVPEDVSWAIGSMRRGGKAPPVVARGKRSSLSSPNRKISQPEGASIPPSAPPLASHAPRELSCASSVQTPREGVAAPPVAGTAAADAPSTPASRRTSLIRSPPPVGAVLSTGGGGTRAGRSASVVSSTIGEAGKIAAVAPRDANNAVHLHQSQPSPPRSGRRITAAADTGPSTFRFDSFPEDAFADDAEDLVSPSELPQRPSLPAAPRTQAFRSKQWKLSAQTPRPTSFADTIESVIESQHEAAAALKSLYASLGADGRKAAHGVFVGGNYSGTKSRMRYDIHSGVKTLYNLSALTRKWEADLAEPSLEVRSCDGFSGTAPGAAATTARGDRGMGRTARRSMTASGLRHSKNTFGHATQLIAQKIEQIQPKPFNDPAEAEEIVAKASTIISLMHAMDPTRADVPLSPAVLTTFAHQATKPSRPQTQGIARRTVARVMPTMSPTTAHGATRRLSVAETVQVLSSRAHDLEKLKESLELLGRPTAQHCSPTSRLFSGGAAASAASIATVDLLCDGRVLASLKNQSKLLMGAAGAPREARQSLSKSPVRSGDVDLDKKLIAARDKGFRKVWQLSRVNPHHLSMAAQARDKPHGAGHSDMEGAQHAANAAARVHFRLQQLHSSEIAQAALMERVAQYKASPFIRSYTFHGQTEAQRSLNQSDKQPHEYIERKNEYEEQFRETARLNSVRNDALAAVRIYKQHQASWMTIVSLVALFDKISSAVLDSRLARLNMAAVLFLQRMWRNFRERRQARHMSSSLETIRRWLIRFRYRFLVRAKQRAAQRIATFLLDSSKSVTGFTIKCASDRLIRRVKLIQRAVRKFQVIQACRLQLMIRWWHEAERLQHQLALARERTKVKSLAASSKVSKPQATAARRNSVAGIPTTGSASPIKARRNSIGTLNPTKEKELRIEPPSPMLTIAAPPPSPVARDDDVEDDIEIDAVWMDSNLSTVAASSTFLTQVPEMPRTPTGARVPQLALSRTGTAYSPTFLPDRRAQHLRDLPVQERRGTRLLLQAALSDDVLFSATMSGLDDAATHLDHTVETGPPGRVSEDVTKRSRAAMVLEALRAKHLTEIDIQTRNTLLKRYLTRRLQEAAGRCRLVREERAAALQDQAEYHAERLESARVRNAAIKYAKRANRGKQASTATLPDIKLPERPFRHRTIEVDVHFIHATETHAKKLLQLDRLNTIRDGNKRKLVPGTTEVGDMHAKSMLTTYDCNKWYPPFRLITASGSRAMTKLIAIARYSCNQEYDLLGKLVAGLQMELFGGTSAEVTVTPLPARPEPEGSKPSAAIRKQAAAAPPGDLMPRPPPRAPENPTEPRPPRPVMQRASSGRSV